MTSLDVDQTSLGWLDAQNAQSHNVSKAFMRIKRAADLVICILTLPLIVAVSLTLLVINPFLNPGPVFYVQTRMGLGCRPFRLLKFRTMRGAGTARAADAPLEHNRITPLGRILRKTRIDELPQMLNVLRGEMSLIGPRPDCFSHALEFLEQVPGYRARHMVLPGISGLAQTEVGYVEGAEATRLKLKADLYYISNAGLLLELWIVWRTFGVILGCRGS